MRDVVESSIAPAALPTDESLPQAPRAEATADVQELTSTLASRDQFLGLIGHELRNALAPMLLLADQFNAMAGAPGAPAALASRTAALQRNLHKLVGTVDRITQVTDLRRGKLLLEPSAVDLVQIADEVCREADRQAAAGGVLLVLDAAAPVPGNWDRARVKQIIASLVSNAIRYGGGRIEIGVRARDDGAEISVRDHGTGIHPEILPRLFDAFDQERARGSGGFGVGLWVVKTLSVAMRGSVTAENCESGGARFCVFLPRG